MGDDGIPPFPVIIVVGLAVFGLAFIVAQDFEVTGEEPGEQVVFMSESFGEVGSAEHDLRTVTLGDFTVGETRGDVQAYRTRQERLENRLFGSDNVVVEYNATQPREGNVEFDILGRDGDGAVYVEANDERVFEEQMISGSSQDVEIPEGVLNHGMNEIVLGTTRGGLLSSTTYTVEDVEVTVNDRRFHDYRDSFRIYDYELQDFVDAELTFGIASSVRTDPLEIYVNGNQVYSHEQVRVLAEEVKLDRGDADLVPGYNSITFETDGEAEYEIENAQVTMRSIGTTDTQTLRDVFEMDSAELSFAQSDDTRTLVRFDYQQMLPSPRPMEIEINGEEVYELTPENGENEVEVSAEDLIEGDNVVVISSDTAYQLNNFQVLSERVEE